MSSTVKIIENFADYDQVLEYYKSVLNYWKHEYNTKDFNKGKSYSNFVLLNSTTVVKVYINSAISKMLRNMEILKKSSYVNDDLYKQLLKNVYIKCNLDKFVVKKQDDLTEDQVITCIRNGAAHATFKIAIIDDMLCLKFEDEKMKAVIPFTIINGIANVIRDYRVLHCKRDTFVANYYYLDNLNTTKLSEWQSALDKLTIVKTDKEISEFFVTCFESVPSGTKNLILFPPKATPIHQEKLDSETRRLIGRYIKYYGEKQWININPNFRSLILSLFLDKLINNKFYDVHSEYYYIKPIKSDDDFLYITPNTERDNPFNMAINTPYISPFAFSSVLADYICYSLNFAKEASTRDKINEAIYNDIEVKKVEFLGGKESDYIKYIDNSQYLLDEHKKLVKQRKSARRKLNSCTSQKENMNKNTSLSEEEKKEKITLLEEQINEKSEEIKELTHLISINEKETKEFKPHYAYQNEFFRRLRNGITHFTYDIDYKPGIYKKDFNNMILIISDSTMGDDFKIKISVGELTKICETLTQRIKQRSKFYYENKQIGVNVPTDLEEAEMKKLEAIMENWAKDTNFEYIIGYDAKEVSIDKDKLVDLFSDYGLGIDDDKEQEKTK